jgi:hypothetical protein
MRMPHESGTNTASSRLTGSAAVSAHSGKLKNGRALTLIAHGTTVRSGQIQL